MDCEKRTDISYTGFHYQDIDIVIASSAATLNQCLTVCMPDYQFSSQTKKKSIIKQWVSEIERKEKRLYDSSSHTDISLSHNYNSFFSNLCFFSAWTSGTGNSSSGIEDKIENEKLILDRVRNLVENGHISEARNILSTIQHGISKKIDNWLKVLAKPKIKIGNSATGDGSKENALWIYRESLKYKGMWVALKKGVLIGYHNNRIELQQSLKEANKLSGATFFQVGGS